MIDLARALRKKMSTLKVSSPADTAIAIRSLLRPRKSFIPIACFVVITLILNARILMADGVPIHGDLTFPWNLDNYLDNYLYVFSDAGSIPNLESIDRAAALLPLTVLADLLGLGTAFVHRVIYLALPLVSLLSMLALLRHVLGRIDPRYVRPAVLVPPSVLFTLSPWVLEQVQAYLFWLAYALTPLLILLSLRFFAAPKFLTACAVAATLTLIAATPQYLVFSVGIVLIICVSELSERARRTSRVSLAREMGVWLPVLAGTFLAFNFYWLFPTLKILTSGNTISPGFEASETMTSLFSTNSSGLNVLRGYDQWITWYAADTRLHFVFNSFWILNSLFIPIASFWALLSSEGRRSRPLRTIALIALIFAVLALGTSTPLYDWLVFRVPFVRQFGWVLRVPGKMSYLLWVFYGVAIAIIIAKILNHSHKVFRRLVNTALMVSIGILILPKTFVYFYDYYVPVSVPRPYEELNTFLAQNAGGGRALFLAPYDFAFGENELAFETSYFWNPGRLAAASPAISSPVPSIGYYHLTYRNWQGALYPLIYPRIPDDLGEKFLAPAGVQYVVYHNDIVGAEDRGTRDIEKLEASDLVPLARFGWIHLFENPWYEGIVRAGPGKDPEDVDIRKVNPAKYEIIVKGPAVTYVEIGLPFDALWSLKAGSHSIPPTQQGSTVMRFDIPTDAPRTLTLEYFPQPFYGIGLAVSTAFGAGICLVGLILYLRTRRQGGSRPL